MSVYQQRILEIHQALGIPESYAEDFALPLIEETNDLIRIENDIFDRKQLISVTVIKYWQAMRQAAMQDNISLLLISAFRSVDYQAQLIAAKLDRGQSMDQILAVNAAPGYSEHHSGCALDLTCPGCEPLHEQFEQSDAFKWLSENAARYGFRMSYPKTSQTKIIYEPWHWACLGSIKSA